MTPSSTSFPRECGEPTGAGDLTYLVCRSSSPLVCWSLDFDKLTSKQVDEPTKLTVAGQYWIHTSFAAYRSYLIVSILCSIGRNVNARFFALR